jgi:predicted DNA-binding transcriptional regulator YafY
MGYSSRKRDRTARLLKLQLLLWQNPTGLTISEIARKCSVSERTVFRDLIALETELKVPLWGEGNKRGILEGYFLSPITLTTEEAVNIFLASRLMSQMSQIYSPHIASTFMKINTIVPQPLKRHVQKTIDKLERLPTNEVRIRNFEKLTEAWSSHRQVQIIYQEKEDKSEEHIIEIYFIEPDFWGRCSYVIAYDQQSKTIDTFYTNRIIGHIIIKNETYETPEDFELRNFIDETFGIYTSKNTMTFKLQFSPKVSKAVSRTIWHPSQKMELLDNFSMIMTLRMRNAIYLRGWILGWGTNVEVLKPKWLRNQIIDINETLGEMYRNKARHKSDFTPIIH